MSDAGEVIQKINKSSIPTDSTKQITKLGVCFPLILLYVYLDHGRPDMLLSLRLAMIISIVLFMGWILSPGRKWNRQIVCFIMFIGIMASGIVFAENTYDAFWTTYAMVVTILFFCIPVIHFVDSLQKIKIFIDTIIVVFGYVGVYAILHEGFGPGGAASAQDENYVSASMAIVFPLAYFALLSERNGAKRILYLVCLGLYLMATIVTFSRGGFIGMALVVIYCVAKTPKKWVGGFMAIIVAIGVISVAKNEYWTEMRTIMEVEEGSAQHRLELWKIAVRQFLDNPITGVGPGNFRWNIEWYQSEEQIRLFGRSLAGSAFTHSLFLELLAENGILGVIVFMMILRNLSKDMKLIDNITRQLRIPMAEVPEHKRAQSVKGIDDGLMRISHYRQALVGATIGCLAGGLFLSFLYFSHFWTIAAISAAFREVTVAKTGDFA